MTKHELACYCLEALYNVETWTNTDHGEYKRLMRRSKENLEENYEYAYAAKRSVGMEPPDIKPFDIGKLHNEYYNHEGVKHLRFGQWFVNTYVEGVWPELFYEKDQSRAFEMIMEKAND